MKDKTILITRAKEDNKELREDLEKKGAEVLELPMIEFSPVEDLTEIHRYLNELETFDWIVFTSVRAVAFFFQIANEQGVKFYFYPNLKIATVGEKTKLKLEQLGYRTNFVPIQYMAEVLAENMDENIRGKKILIPRSDKANDEYLEVFRKREADPVAVKVYRNNAVLYPKKEFVALMNKEPDYFTFTSGSAFKAFHSNLVQCGLSLSRQKIISIGPSTSKVIKSLGCKVHAEAEPHTTEGMISAIEKIEKND